MFNQRRKPGIAGQIEWFAGSPYQGAFRTRSGFGMLISHKDLCEGLRITHAGYAQEREALHQVDVEVVVRQHKIIEMRPILPVRLEPVNLLPDYPDGPELFVIDEWQGQAVGIETMGTDTALATGKYWKAVSFVTRSHSIQAVYHRSPAGAAALLQRLYGHRGHVGEFLNAGLRIGVQNDQTVLYVFVREVKQRFYQWTIGHYGLLETMASIIGVDRIQIVHAPVARPFVLGIGADGLLTLDSCRVLTWNGLVVSQEEDWLEHAPEEIVRHLTSDGLNRAAREALLNLKEYRQATKSQDNPQGIISARDYARLLLALYNQGGFDSAYAFLPIIGGLEFPEPYSADEIRRAVEATERVAYPVRQSQPTPTILRFAAA